MPSVDEDAIRAELAAILATFGKADVSRRLLTYLVESHLRDKVPRETDIALDVFNRDSSFDGAHDAVVRVAVRALRQKLDEFYHQAGRYRPLRLTVPRGGYRLTLLPAASNPAPHAADPTSHPAPDPAPERAPEPRETSRRPVLVALGALLLASLLLNAWALRHRAGAPAASPPAPVAQSSPIWQPLLASDRPLTIVLGDLLLFPNPTADPGRIQLVRDARINTAEQLRAYLAARGEVPAGAPGTQVETTLVPKSVAYGLVDVLPVVQGDGRRPIEVQILDELRIDDLRTHDVLFIGPLVRIGPLADALFRGSRYVFHYEDEPRRLKDSRSGREFAPSPGRRENANDYGLFASFRGETGNRIMVFASVGSDLGLLPLMRRMTAANGLDELRARLTADGREPLPDQFEALLSVTGYYRTDLSAELIEAHARPVAAQASASASSRNAP